MNEKRITSKFVIWPRKTENGEIIFLKKGYFYECFFHCRFDDFTAMFCSFVLLGGRADPITELFIGRSDKYPDWIKLKVFKSKEEADSYLKLVNTKSNNYLDLKKKLGIS